MRGHTLSVTFLHSFTDLTVITNFLILFFRDFFRAKLDSRAEEIPEVRKCVSPTSQDENITLIYEISADLYPTKEARSKHNKSFFRTDQSVLLHPLTFGILN
jgi:hypothetical protein